MFAKKWKLSSTLSRGYGLPSAALARAGRNGTIFLATPITITDCILSRRRWSIIGTCVAPADVRHAGAIATSVASARVEPQKNGGNGVHSELVCVVLLVPRDGPAELLSIAKSLDAVPLVIGFQVEVGLALFCFP